MKAFEFNIQGIEPLPVLAARLSSGAEIPAVIVGERGRNRRRGLLPVKGAQAGGVLSEATVGLTKAGRPCLIAGESNPDDGLNAIISLRPMYGFRGGAGWEVICGEAKTLVDGHIAQGIAGRMGGADQAVVVVQPGTTIKVWRTGRLYGDPPEILIHWNGENLLWGTPEEVEAAEIW